MQADCYMQAGSTGVVMTAANIYRAPNRYAGSSLSALPVFSHWNGLLGGAHFIERGGC